ncbi:MAG: flagellar hook-length control protein FliK [bacterium]
MIFNPLFIEKSSNSGGVSVTKSPKIAGANYLFNDIINVYSNSQATQLSGSGSTGKSLGKSFLANEEIELNLLQTAEIDFSTYKTGDVRKFVSDLINLLGGTSDQKTGNLEVLDNSNGKSYSVKLEKLNSLLQSIIAQIKFSQTDSSAQTGSKSQHVSTEQIVDLLAKNKGVLISINDASQLSNFHIVEDTENENIEQGFAKYNIPQTNQENNYKVLYKEVPVNSEGNEIPTFGLAFAYTGNINANNSEVNDLTGSENIIISNESKIPTESENKNNVSFFSYDQKLDNGSDIAINNNFNFNKLLVNNSQNTDNLQTVVNKSTNQNVSANLITPVLVSNVKSDSQIASVLPIENVQTNEKKVELTQDTSLTSEIDKNVPAVNLTLKGTGYKLNKLKNNGLKNNNQVQTNEIVNEKTSGKIESENHANEVLVESANSEKTKSLNSKNKNEQITEQNYNVILNSSNINVDEKSSSKAFFTTGKENSVDDSSNKSQIKNESTNGIINPTVDKKANILTENQNILLDNKNTVQPEITFKNTLNTAVYQSGVIVTENTINASINSTSTEKNVLANTNEQKVVSSLNNNTVKNKTATTNTDVPNVQKPDTQTVNTANVDKNVLANTNEPKVVSSLNNNTVENKIAATNTDVPNVQKPDTQTVNDRTNYSEKINVDKPTVIISDITDKLLNSKDVEKTGSSKNNDFVNDNIKNLGDSKNIVRSSDFTKPIIENGGNEAVDNIKINEELNNVNSFEKTGQTKDSVNNLEINKKAQLEENDNKVLNKVVKPFVLRPSDKLNNNDQLAGDIKNHKADNSLINKELKNSEKIIPSNNYLSDKAVSFEDKTNTDVKNIFGLVNKEEIKQSFDKNIQNIKENKTKELPEIKFEFTKKENTISSEKSSPLIDNNEVVAENTNIKNIKNIENTEFVDKNIQYVEVEQKGKDIKNNIPKENYNIYASKGKQTNNEEINTSENSVSIKIKRSLKNVVEGNSSEQKNSDAGKVAVEKPTAKNGENIHTKNESSFEKAITAANNQNSTTGGNNKENKENRDNGNVSVNMKIGEVDNKENKVFDDLITKQNTNRTVKLAEIVKEVSRYLEKQEKGNLVINIEPENLGKIKISVEIQDKVVRANITVENETVKTMLESKLGDLQSNLNKNGGHSNLVNISLQENEQKNAKNNSSRRKNNGEDKNVSAVEEVDENVTKSMGYNTYEYLA